MKTKLIVLIALAILIGCRGRSVLDLPGVGENLDEEDEYYLTPNPTPSPTSTPQAPDKCKATFGDGRGGTLWKESEHGGQFVLLLPNNCTTKNVRLCATRCKSGVYTGLANPDENGERHHWRWLGSAKAVRSHIGKGKPFLKIGNLTLQLPGALRKRHD